MSQLTTHILDTTKGKPAQGVTIILFHQEQRSCNSRMETDRNRDYQQ